MIKTGKIRYLWLFQAAADLSAIIASYYTTLLIRFHSEWGDRFFSSVNRILGVRETGTLGGELETFYIISAPRIILFIFVTLAVLYALRDLYPGRRFIRRRPAAWSLVVANAAAIALFYIYFYLQRNVFHPRSVFAMMMLLNVFYSIAFRGSMDRFLNWLRSHYGMDVHSAFLLGSSSGADYVSLFITRFHPHGIHIVGSSAFDTSRPFEKQIAELETAARDLKIDMMISAEKDLSVAQIMQLIDMSERLGTPIKVLSDKLDVLPNQAHMPVDFFHGIPLVHFESPATPGPAHWATRALSALVSYIGMLIFLPIMGLIALLIRLTSKGPAVFVQERIGVNRKPFLMYKFRTMHDKADELRAQVEEFSDSRGPLFKIKDDPRVTPLGRFLRRFSLDELPQLFNVVRGEMAIVGPRPLPREDFEGYYEDWHYSRHSGMPGLTCLWQVSGRSDVDFHNMCILDIYYLRNRNWVLDLRILLRTLWVVLFAKGAY